jgi:hypothetical protein
MLKLRLFCPKHIRFDPAKHSLADVKGNCAWCQRLLVLWQQGQLFHREVAETQAKKGKALVGL